jgi:hypothetical protein
MHNKSGLYLLHKDVEQKVSDFLLKTMIYGRDY